MTILLLLYGVGMIVGAHCAARFIRRLDRTYNLLPRDWDGLDWLSVIHTAIFWPVGIPLGHMLTRDRPFPSFLWLQRLLGGPR